MQFDESMCFGSHWYINHNPIQIYMHWVYIVERLWKFNAHLDPLEILIFSSWGYPNNPTSLLMLFPGRLSDSQAITKIVFHFQVMCLISLLSGFCGTTQLDFITRHGQSETNQVLPTLLPIPFVISDIWFVNFIFFR